MCLLSTCSVACGSGVKPTNTRIALASDSVREPKLQHKVKVSHRVSSTCNTSRWEIQREDGDERDELVKEMKRREREREREI